MRTKTLLLAAAALAAGVISSQAQSNVYSANVVGYVNLTVPAGEYKLIANQFVSSNTTVDVLFPTVPGGTSLSKWVGSGYAVNNFDADFGWDDPTMTFLLGEGTFIKNNSGSPITVTFVGEVATGANVTSIASGYQMSGSKVPVAGLIQTDLGYQPIANEQVIMWNSGAYGVSTYDPDFGWDAEPQLQVGDGFFFNSPAAHSWTNTLTIQ